MGTEILVVSDRLLAAVVNGIYQGILITVLVGLGFRVFSRTNAATRHAVWLCTLVLLVFLVVAHCFFPSRPLALKPGKFARTAPTPEHEVDTPNVAAVSATTDGLPTEIGTSGPKWPGFLSVEQEQPGSQKPVSLPLGGAGDPPAPVGDPPTGTAAGKVAKRPFPLARTVAPVPSGESPDGTGGSPVPPANHFSNTL